MRIAIALATLIVLLGCTGPAVGAGPPQGLSRQGRALWNFEALLHDTSGHRLICTPGSSLNFVAGTCSPLAIWEPYLSSSSDLR